MRKLIKPTLYSFMAISLLSSCGEESLYDKEVPMITRDDVEGLDRNEYKALRSETFKEVQAFVKEHREELGEKDYDKLLTTLTGKGMGAKLPEGTTVGDILGKTE